MEPAPGESEGKPLCLNCLTPNEASDHFCSKCGAPMTSYAATAPFESLFAEGHVYRQATEKPRNLVVVLGIWMIFGTMAAGGALLVFSSTNAWYLLAGLFLLAISLTIIWKTTVNYIARSNVPTESPSESFFP